VFHHALGGNSSVIVPGEGGSFLHAASIWNDASLRTKRGDWIDTRRTTKTFVRVQPNPKLVLSAASSHLY